LLCKSISFNCIFSGTFSTDSERRIENALNTFSLALKSENYIFNIAVNIRKKYSIYIICIMFITRSKSDKQVTAYRHSIVNRHILNVSNFIYLYYIRGRWLCAQRLGFSITIMYLYRTHVKIENRKNICYA